MKVNPKIRSEIIELSKDLVPIKLKNLTPAERKVLSLVMQNKSITNDQLAILTNLKDKKLSQISQMTPPKPSSSTEKTKKGFQNALGLEVSSKDLRKQILTAGDMEVIEKLLKILTPKEREVMSLEIQKKPLTNEQKKILEKLKNDKPDLSTRSKLPSSQTEKIKKGFQNSLGLRISSKKLFDQFMTSELYNKLKNLRPAERLVLSSHLQNKPLSEKEKIILKNVMTKRLKEFFVPGASTDSLKPSSTTGKIKKGIHNALGLSVSSKKLGKQMRFFGQPE